ncbi:conserved hypothetical protein [Neisseria gonorrhoeae PID332]|nr:conserved hypothetical protein [Neisseria gonorrhoeae PID332]
MQQFKFGGHSELVPRLPIPNRTVKRLSADDSVVLPCESRSLPNTLSENPRISGGFCFARKKCRGWRDGICTVSGRVCGGTA